METLEFNHEDFTKPRQGDEKLAIRFFKKAYQDMDQTRAQGRPIFDEGEYMQLMVPGDRNHVIVRPISEDDKHRFAKQYEDWKKNNSDEGIIGTTLEAWNQMSLSQIEEFRYFGVRTVEHMASLRDDVMLKMPGAIKLKEQAQIFLDAAKAAAPLAAVQEELAKRDNELETLRAAIADQGALIAQLQAKKAA